MRLRRYKRAVKKALKFSSYQIGLQACPKTGVNKTPGRANTATSKSTRGSEMVNATSISGNAGVISDVPRIADKETKMIM